MILSWLMEKLNIKRVVSMQKTKTNSALGFKQRPFLLRKSPSLTLRIGRRLFSENSYKIRAMSNRPNSNVLFIMLMYILGKGNIEGHDLLDKVLPC